MLINLREKQMSNNRFLYFYKPNKSSHQFGGESRPIATLLWVGLGGVLGGLGYRMLPKGSMSDGKSINFLQKKKQFENQNRVSRRILDLKGPFARQEEVPFQGQAQIFDFASALREKMKPISDDEVVKIAVDQSITYDTKIDQMKLLLRDAQSRGRKISFGTKDFTISELKEVLRNDPNSERPMLRLFGKMFGGVLRNFDG